MIKTCGRRYSVIKMHPAFEGNLMNQVFFKNMVGEMRKFMLK